MRTTILITSDEFIAPGLELFDLGPIFPGGPAWLTKPVLIAMLSAIIIIAFCWAAFAKPKMVPRGWQSMGEYVYDFVYVQIARSFLRPKDAERWMGLLLTIFLTVLVWNLMGVIPFIQYPVAANVTFPAALAIIVYLVKVYLAIKHHGLRPWLKEMLAPADLPRWAIGFFAPLMFAEVFINSLFTHFIRVFANMFAGHVLLAFFSSLGFWFLFEKLTPLGAGIGVIGVVMTILMTAFEMFIQFLQAFLFALLTSMYLASSLYNEH
ncbi:F0F1 ATP synthase subunit A [Nonomuraea sp. NN258]|uniref:F0F1 ATP synthase subunit A n=1 Tax=Nonomuraea antri TaxID=2730852 RepID=UPI00156A3DFA|nr:F0F1 ATP synthase subunit A [Nonomuraea antri]NRQ36167.1 F0F1 ATP synthase subunit A [Nonomuraea antri]